MKRFSFMMLGIVALALAASGCVSISKYTPPSSEEEKPIVKGQIGKAEPKIKVEVELLEKPDLSRFSAPKTPDSEITGNAGTFAGGFMKGSNVAAWEETGQEPKVWWTQQQASEEFLQQEALAPQVTIVKYKVKKGQTLGEIAALPEFYGDSKKWRKIYEVNKDKIKDPNKIYAGQILDIPVESEGTASVQHLK
jgi:nucleoid-associated protein YgaU